MRIDNPPQSALNACFTALDKRAALAGRPEVQYVDLGVCVVRLINHSKAFVPHLEKQLAWSLRDAVPHNDMPHYDATLVIWQERDFGAAALSLYGPFATPEQYRKLRVQRLAQPKATPVPEVVVRVEDVSRYHPLVQVSTGSGIISAWNPATNTHYYSAENLEAEEFAKHGHIFVKTFSRILQSASTSLVHGAAVGLGGKGVLLCALGYRGKTTLSVSALLDGFDYVSDDYLVLGREQGVLRAWPIYSVIALAPDIYGKLYHRLRAQFVSNNGRKDKYIFTISEYHPQFVSGYPISLCIYPRKTLNAEPSIVPGDKELAIEEFVFSTAEQMGDLRNAGQIAKLHSFVADLPCYRFNLSPNIDKNIRCLREFLEGLS